MAHLFQGLLRRRPPMTTCPSLINHNSLYQTLTSAIFSQFINSRLRSLLPFPPKVESEKPQVKFDFTCPSFSYGLKVNPVFQKVLSEEEEVVVEEGGENELGKMWADSTKKKR